jgi:hypothetical protein
MLKRWWWVAAAVVVVAVVGAFLLSGRGTPQAQSPGGQTVDASGAQTPATTTSGTVPGTPSGTSTAAPATAKPSKPGSVKVAKKGARLTTITAPPTETLAQIRYTATRSGQSYRAAFRLYGKGPVRAGHGTVVALVSSFTPTKAYSDALQLPSDNVLLELGPGVSLGTGGSYTGLVTLTKRGDALVLVLTGVKPA